MKSKSSGGGGSGIYCHAKHLMYRVLTQCKNLDVNDDHLDTHRDDIFDTKATLNSEHKGTAEREQTINHFFWQLNCVRATLSAATKATRLPAISPDND